jgi:hypothetical protein
MKNEANSAACGPTGEYKHKAQTGKKAMVS